jgi:hypothetical protein
MSSQNASKRVRVGAVSDFADGQRMLVPNGDYTIGVFRVDGGFRAYDNVCLHQGGPVCEGRYFPLMTAVVDEGGRALGERYDESSRTWSARGTAGSTTWRRVRRRTTAGAGCAGSR